MNRLIVNIGQLAGIRAESRLLRGKELADLPIIPNAYLRVKNGLIDGYGPMSALNGHDSANEELIDAKNATVLPAWCDSHTHLVFAASRENAFVDKLHGLSYAQIAAKGGGILNSARKLNDTPEETLYELACERLLELMRLGTGAIEIKSGYGLTVEGEIKMLRVIRRLKKFSCIPIKASFLGAHTIPAAYKDNREADCSYEPF